MPGAERILILGVGNILLKDEGIGVHVVRELEKKNLPGNVEVMDAGTAVIDMMPYFENVKKLIVIDAVRAGREPGTIYRFAPEDIYENNKMSLHQMGLLEALTMSREIGKCPGDAIVIGVEPEIIEPGLGLSEKLSCKVPDIVNTVIKEIKGGQDDSF